MWRFAALWAAWQMVCYGGETRSFLPARTRSPPTCHAVADTPCVSGLLLSTSLSRSGGHPLRKLVLQNGIGHIHKIDWIRTKGRTDHFCQTGPACVSYAYLASVTFTLPLIIPRPAVFLTIIKQIYPRSSSGFLARSIIKPSTSNAKYCMPQAG